MFHLSKGVLKEILTRPSLSGTGSEDCGGNIIIKHGPKPILSITDIIFIPDVENRGNSNDSSYIIMLLDDGKGKALAALSQSDFNSMNLLYSVSNLIKSASQLAMPPPASIPKIDFLKIGCVFMLKSYRLKTQSLSNFLIPIEWHSKYEGTFDLQLINTTGISSQRNWLSFLIFKHDWCFNCFNIYFSFFNVYIS